MARLVRQQVAKDVPMLVSVLVVLALVVLA